MIRIDKNNSYLDEFSNELSTYLSTELEKLISNKCILGNKTKISKQHKDDESKYQYSTKDKTKYKQEIKCKVNEESLLCLKCLKNNIQKIVTSDIDSQKKIIRILIKKYPDIKKPKSNIYLLIEDMKQKYQKQKMEQ